MIDIISILHSRKLTLFDESHTEMAISIGTQICLVQSLVSSNYSAVPLGNASSIWTCPVQE